MRKYIFGIVILLFASFLVGYNVYNPYKKQVVQVKNNKYFEEDDDADDDTYLDDQDLGSSDDGDSTEENDYEGNDYSDPDDPEEAEDNEEYNGEDEEYAEEELSDSEDVEADIDENISLNLSAPKDIVCPFDKLYYNNCSGTATNQNLDDSSCGSPGSSARQVRTLSNYRTCKDTDEGDVPVNLSRRIVVLIDDSNSMKVPGLYSGNGTSKINDVNAFFNKLINKLAASGGKDESSAEYKARLKDKLSVCYFNNKKCIANSDGNGYSYKWWKKHYVNVSSKILTDKKCPAGHGTNFQKAYRHAYSQMKKMGNVGKNSKSKSPMVIMITDGYPNGAYSGTTDVANLNLDKQIFYIHSTGSLMMTKSALTLKSFIKIMKQPSFTTTQVARDNVRFYSIGIGMKDSDKLAKLVIAPNKVVWDGREKDEELELKRAVTGQKYYEVVGDISAYPDYGLSRGNVGSKYISFKIDVLNARLNTLKEKTNEKVSKGLGFKFLYNNTSIKVTKVELCNKNSNNKWTKCKATKKYYSKKSSGGNKVYVLKAKYLKNNTKKYVRFSLKSSDLKKIRKQYRKNKKAYDFSKYGVDDVFIGELTGANADTIVGKAVEMAKYHGVSDPATKTVPITIKDYQPYCKTLAASTVKVDNVCYNFPGIGKRRATIQPAQGVTLFEKSYKFDLLSGDTSTYSGGYFVWNGANISNQVQWYYTVNESPKNPLINITSVGAISGGKTVNVHNGKTGEQSSYNLDFNSFSNNLYKFNGSSCTSANYTLSDLSLAVGTKVKDSLSGEISSMTNSLKNSVTTIDSGDAAVRSKKMDLVTSDTRPTAGVVDADLNRNAVFNIGYSIRMQKSWMYCKGNKDCYYKYQNNSPGEPYKHYVDNSYYVPYGLTDSTFYKFSHDISTILNVNLTNTCNVKLNSNDPCFENGSSSTGCNLMIRFRPISITDPFPKYVAANWASWWNNGVGNNKLRLANSYTRNNGRYDYATTTNQIRSTGQANDYDLGYSHINSNGVSNFVSSGIFSTKGVNRFCKKGEWSNDCD